MRVLLKVAYDGTSYSGWQIQPNATTVEGVFSQSENSCEHSYTATVKREPTYDMEGETEFVCSQCGHTYTESVEKLVRHVVSQSVLATALSGAKYRYSQFSVSVGKLMNYAMDGYNVKIGRASCRERV